MARLRWTLALILICLPILATVITAFRVRDLPKSDESVKLDRKPKCDGCDVKFGNTLHSVKIENDKNVYQDIKKSVRERQQQIPTKSDKSSFNFDQSDEAEDKSASLKVEIGIHHSHHKTGGQAFHIFDNNDNDAYETPKKESLLSTKKTEHNLKGLKIKETPFKSVNQEDSSYDDKIKQISSKPQVVSKTLKDNNLVKRTEVKNFKPLLKIKLDNENSNDNVKKNIISKPKISELHETSYSKHTSKDTRNDNDNDEEDLDDTEIDIDEDEDNDDDDDSSDDEDDEDDDEGDGLLSSLWETFSMLGLEIDPSLKPASKKENEVHPVAMEDKNHAKGIKENKIIPQVKQNVKNININSDKLQKKANDLKETVKKSLKIEHYVINTNDHDNNKFNIKESSKATPPLKKIIQGNNDNGNYKDYDKVANKYSYDGKKMAQDIKTKINVKEIDFSSSSSADKISKVQSEIENTDEVTSDGGSRSSLIEKAKTTTSIKNEFIADRMSSGQKTENDSEKHTKKIMLPTSANKNKHIDEQGKKPAIKLEQTTKDKDVKVNKEFSEILKPAVQVIQENVDKALPKKEGKKSMSDLQDTKKDTIITNSEKPSKKIEKKSLPSSTEIKDDFKQGLNIPEIKKEIKAQIRSSREDKRTDKILKEKIPVRPEISSTESNLKQVTEALHRRNLLKSEFEDFYAFFPTFAPNFSRIHNPECRRHGQIVLRQLRGTKLWALNMLDATAKIPSGILQGNGIQLGDFDQCIQSRARVRLESGSLVKVQGKYCLARLDLKAEHPALESLVYLAQAKNLIRSRIDDPGHFVPRFSTLSWGVCVPDVCNPEDVELVIKDAIKHYQKTSGVIIRVKVDETDCHIREADWWQNWIEMPTILTLSFYGISILLVFVATLQDFFTRGTDTAEETENNAKVTEEKGKEKTELNINKQAGGFICSFSLYRTIDKLVAPGHTEDISCIHGIRAIATIALLIAHKFLPVAGMPYYNRLKVTETVSSPLWSWCRAGWMYTDCFLLLSGALTAHKSSDNDNGAPKRLLSKYLRLTPALLAVVLFYAYIWDNTSSGPMWGTFVTKNAQVCKDGWWWNLLYVQNYFGFEDMCAPQTHQLALDMQLTIIGGVLLWLMQMRGVYKFILPALHVVAAYSRYKTVRDHRLTMLAYHGVSVSQLYRTARLSYTSVLHRSTAYLIGISLGLALKNPTEHGKFLLGVGWLSSTALWCLVWWAGADSGSTGYRYQVSFAAQYAALAPIASALAIAWIIYAVHSTGFLSSLLCCRPLVLISRLSYALYLTQFIVFITNVATVKSSSEFTLISLIDIQEISGIILSSVILTLTFVIPMQSLHTSFKFSTASQSTRKNSLNLSEFLKNNLEEKQPTGIQKIKEVNNVEVPQMKIRQHLIAHREVLEEIPETEVEYESQRDNERLGEILEEEEDDELGEESIGNIDFDDDLEIIEEEEGGEDEIEVSLSNRRQLTPRRSYSNEEEQDLNEWEWTSNGNRNGAQYNRYSR